MKLIKDQDMAKLLLDSGLLFRMNREILHPHGLALVVESDDTETKWTISGLWDKRDDPEGIIFASETLAEGVQKLVDFNKEEVSRIQKRLSLLGYIVQPLEKES